MFKSSLYFLKNINNSLFLKLNFFEKKNNDFYKKQINQFLNIYIYNFYLKNKIIKTS